MNLEEYRKNKLKMTQAELAAMLNETQDKISRYEQCNPDDIPLSFFKNLAEKLGTSLDDMLSWTGVEDVVIAKGDELNMEYVWKPVDQTKERLTKFVDTNMTDSFKNYYPRAVELKNECKHIIENSTRKKRIAVVGHSSAGKSTLLDALTGTDKLPTAWTPTTATAIFIRHIDDRSSFMEGDTVLVFKSYENKSFDPSLVYSSIISSEDILAKGGYELLKKYGERDDSSMVNDDVAGIVIYLDSKILKNVDFVDLPGYGTEEVSDDIFTKIISSKMDVLIYLSSSNQFLMGDEISYLRNTIKTLPVFEGKGKNNIKPLGNLFIVASQAHFIPNQEALKAQIRNGKIRFENSLPTSLKEYFSDRSQATGYNIEEYFSDRFFSYTTNRKERRTAFENELKSFIEALPASALSDTEFYLNQFVNTNCKTVSADLDNYKKLQENLEKEEKEYESIIENEPERLKKVHESEKEVYEAISSYTSDSLIDFDNSFDSIINEAHIVNIIKNKGLKRKKEDVKLLADYINAELEDNLNTNLSEYSNKLKFNIDKYLTDFENVSIKGNINSSMFAAFDVRRAFASGLAGLATLGGLSFWATSFGSLGGYILVAKGVSLLSLLGISISGGTATVISAISAIGGPIVLGLAISILAAIAVFSFFSGGWQKEIANKLILAYKDKKYGNKKNQDVRELYHKVIKDFWENTTHAFSLASKRAENEWTDSLNQMKEMIEKSKSDPEFDKQRTIAAENIRNFLLQIPTIVSDKRQ